jgi:beta-galactosidase
MADPEQERGYSTEKYRDDAGESSESASLSISETTRADGRDPAPESAGIAVPDSPGAVENLSAFLENPDLTGISREPPRSTATIPYPSVEAAREADGDFEALETKWDRSPFVRLLNGTWDFAYHEKPDDVPESYAEMEWDSICVPSCWQMEGYDQNRYVNHPLLWEKIDSAENATPPEVPWDWNPVGTYRRSFSVPSDWDGRETFLHFEGVKQVFFCWIDGEFIGYHQGSMTPCEFDVTEHIEAGGDHELTVQVYRLSCFEAIETIDMFRFSGIFRSVFLYAAPTVHIRDAFVCTHLDDEYVDAELQVDATLSSYAESDEGEHELRVHIYDPDGRKVETISTVTYVSEDGAKATISTKLTDPPKWSAEDPALHQVVFELVDPRGKTIEATVERVGVRELEVTDDGDADQILVNGEPVRFRGVNMHEHHPGSGRTVPIETVKEDFELMKQHNVNAVRCAHYPRDPSVYRLADEYGLYLQDELGVETHWNMQLLSETDAYDDAVMDRFQRMVIHNRNRPSITMWSTGNENGYGPVEHDMYDFGVGADGTRPVLGHNAEPFDVNMMRWTQNMYPSPTDLETVALGEETRPLLLGEYNHALGNSLGLVEDFWTRIFQPAFGQETVASLADVSSNGVDAAVLGEPALVDGRDDDGAIALPEDTVAVAEDSDRLDFETPGFALALGLYGTEEHYNGRTPLLTNGEGSYGLTIRAAVGDDETDAELELYIVDAAEASDGRVDPSEMTKSSEAMSGQRPGKVAVRWPLPDGWVNSWHDVTGVVMENRLVLHVDGEAVATKTHNVETVAKSRSPFGIGFDPDKGSGRWRRGDRSVTVDSVRVADRPLIGDEMHSPPDDALALEYRCDKLDVGVRKWGPDRYPQAQGGFIWDWVDQSLTDTTTIDGETAEYNFYDDDPMCLNGVVFSDRTPQPELIELKRSHQPVTVQEADLTAGKIRVTNHNRFTNLAAYDVFWELSADDEVRQSGELDLSVPPGETTTISVPFDDPVAVPGTEYWLAIEFQLATDLSWADRGHVVAAEQLRVPFDVPNPDPIAFEELAPLRTDSAAESYTVSGENFEYAFDADCGTLSSVTYDGFEMVSTGPRLNLYRPPIENEVARFGDAQADDWYEIGLDDLRHDVRSVSVTSPGEGTGPLAGDAVAKIDVQSVVTGAESEAGVDAHYRFHVLGSGDIFLGANIEPNQALRDAIDHFLPRIGVSMDVPDRFSRFEWYGRGPHETYPDRKNGAHVDRYAKNVSDLHVPYLPPQENGNRTDVRWASLTDSATSGLALFGKPTVNVNLDLNSNLETADYEHELKRKDGAVTVNLDDVVTGVGGTPVPPLPQHRVRPEPTNFVVGIRPFTPGETTPAALWKRQFPDIRDLIPDGTESSSRQ